MPSALILPRCMRVCVFVDCKHNCAQSSSPSTGIGTCPMLRVELPLSSDEYRPSSCIYVYVQNSIYETIWRFSNNVSTCRENILTIKRKKERSSERNGTKRNERMKQIHLLRVKTIRSDFVLYDAIDREAITSSVQKNRCRGSDIPLVEPFVFFRKHGTMVRQLLNHCH